MEKIEGTEDEKPYQKRGGYEGEEGGIVANIGGKDQG